MKKTDKQLLQAAQAEIAKLRKKLAAEPVKIEPGTSAQFRHLSRQRSVIDKMSTDQALQFFKPAQHPAQATPKEGKMAMDAWETAYGSWAGASISSAYAEGQEFLGYPQLSLMAQRGEYRTIVTVLATEMTRKWIRIKSVSDDKSKQDKINHLDKFMKKLRVRQKFKRAAELDFYFGRGHLFLEFGGIKNGIDPEETKHSVGWGDDDITRGKVNRANPLTRIQPVEPVWVYPMSYNTNDPLDPNWYRPEHWFVLGKQVHSTRLLRFVMDEVADLLKPAYSFGGLSKTQIAKPYVDNWLYARQSVADLLRSFTTYVLKTNLMATLKDGGASLYERLEIFANLRDNSGIFALDTNTEDFANVSAPLGGLDKLQAQAQEQICSISRIPLIKYTGITPSGLNQSSDGELQAFGETIKSFQEAEFEDNLRTVFHHCQMSLWDEVDEDLDFEFLPLAELSELDKATKRATDSQVDATYIEAGAIDAMEVRQRLAKDPDTLYPGLDADKRPEQPTMPGMGEEGEEGGPEDGGEGGAPQKGSPGGGNGGDPFDNLRRLAAKPEASQESSWGNLALLAHDDFSEHDHPRGPNGKFGKGGNGTQNLKMERVTERKGSNPGGVFKTAEGEHHYVKFYKNPQQGKVEQLASHLFERLGAPTPSPRMAVVNGEQALITKWNHDIERLAPADFAKLNDKQQKQVAKMYLGAVLTKNWDVVGLEHDNIVRNKKTGDMMEVDTGGAFHFRAMGGAKPYGPDIAEFDSLRDPKLPSGNVFNAILKQNPAALKEAVAEVKHLNMASIKQDFADSGLDNASELYDAFAARRSALLQRTSSLGQDSKAFYRRWLALDDAQFVEYEHPREKNGQFSKVPYQGVKELKKWHGAPKTEGKPHELASPSYNNIKLHKALGHKSASIPAQIVNQMLENEGGLIEAAHIAQKQYGNSEEKTVAQMLAHMNNIKKGFEKGGAAEHGLTLLKHKWGGKVYYGVKHQETVPKDKVETGGVFAKAAEASITTTGGGVEVTGSSPLKETYDTWQNAKLTGGNWEKQQLAKLAALIASTWGKQDTTFQDISVKLAQSYELSKQNNKPIQQSLEQILASHGLTNTKANTPNPGASVTAPAPAPSAPAPALSTAQKIENLIDKGEKTSSLDQEAKKSVASIAEHAAGLDGDNTLNSTLLSAVYAYEGARAAIATYKNLHNLTPEEGAYVKLYSGTHYRALNRQLRQGKTTKGGWVFAQKLNSVLSKLPDHKGVVERGTNVDPSVYEVGMVIEERGFTSTSTKTGFGGNVRYHIISKTGKSIRNLSNHPGEEEILFRSGTRFEVTKVDKKGHGSATIHMTEMTDDE